VCMVVWYSSECKRHAGGFNLALDVCFHYWVQNLYAVDDMLYLVSYTFNIHSLHLICSPSTLYISLLAIETLRRGVVPRM